MSGTRRLVVRPPTVAVSRANGVGPPMSNPPGFPSSTGSESPRPSPPPTFPPANTRQDHERDLERRLARFERMLRQRAGEFDPDPDPEREGEGGCDHDGSPLGYDDHEAPTDLLGDPVALFDPIADLDDLAGYLPEGPPAHRLEVLGELIRSHLEWCHEHLPTPLCPQVEADYLQRFPELAHAPEVAAAIRYEEQRQRLRRGETATPPPRSLAPVRQRDHAPSPCGLAPDSRGDRSSRSVGDVAVAYLHHLRREQDPKLAASTERESPRHADPDNDSARSTAIRREFLDTRSGPLDPLDRDALALFERLDREAPNLARRIAEAAAALERLGPGSHAIKGFRLLEQIGRGAFGRVFLARQNRYDLAFRQVVLKVVASECERGEASALARLHHTHIVPIHSVHAAGPLLVICMQYLGRHTLDVVIAARHRPPGRSRRKVPPWGGASATGSPSGILAARSPDHGQPVWSDPSTSWAGDHEPGRSSWWRRKSNGSNTGIFTASDSTLSGLSLGPTPAERRRLKHQRRLKTVHRLAQKLSDLDQACWFALKLVRALKFAHARGIQHGDLKPANILVSNHGEPLLLDFNLSRRLRATVGLEMDRLGGTLPYMAPEALEALAARNPLPPDLRADLYSLGVVLHELFTGRLPYDTPDGSPNQVVARMIRERRATRPRPRFHNPEMSPGLEAILLRCLEARPEDRYQSAGHLATDLKRHLKHWPLKYAVNPSKREHLLKAIRRRPLAFASLVGVALFIPLMFAYVQKRIDFGVAEGNRIVLEQISASLVVADRFDRIEQESDQLDQAIRGALARVLKVGEPARSQAARDLANRLGGEALRLARDLLEFERCRDEFQSDEMLLRLLGPEPANPVRSAANPIELDGKAAWTDPPSILERLRGSALHPAHRQRRARVRVELGRALSRVALVADHAASSRLLPLAEIPSRTEESHPVELSQTADDALRLAHQLFAPDQEAAARFAQRLATLLEHTRNQSVTPRTQELAAIRSSPPVSPIAPPWKPHDLPPRDPLDLDPILAHAVGDDPTLDHLLVLRAGLQGRLGEEPILTRALAAAEAARSAHDPDPVPDLLGVLSLRAVGEFHRARARWETLLQTRLFEPLRPDELTDGLDLAQREPPSPPGLDDLVALQAELHRRAADPVQTCTSLRILQRLRPDDPAVHLGLAESLISLLESPRPDRALRDWARLRLPQFEPIHPEPETDGSDQRPTRSIASTKPTLMDLARVTLAEARREVALVERLQDDERPRLVLVRDRLNRLEAALTQDPHLFTASLTSDSESPAAPWSNAPAPSPSVFLKPNVGVGLDNTDLHAIVRMALKLPLHFGAGTDRDTGAVPALNLAQIAELLTLLERSKQLDAEHLDLRPLSQALVRCIPHAAPAPAPETGGVDPPAPEPPSPLVLQARAFRLIASDADTLDRYRGRLERSPDEIHALDLLIDLTLSVSGPHPLRLNPALPRLRAWARRLSQLAPSHPRLIQVRPLMEADL